MQTPNKIYNSMGKETKISSTSSPSITPLHFRQGQCQCSR